MLINPSLAEEATESVSAPVSPCVECEAAPWPGPEVEVASKRGTWHAAVRVGEAAPRQVSV